MRRGQRHTRHAHRDQEPQQLPRADAGVSLRDRTADRRHGADGAGRPGLTRIGRGARCDLLAAQQGTRARLSLLPGAELAAFHIDRVGGRSHSHFPETPQRQVRAFRGDTASRPMTPASLVGDARSQITSRAPSSVYSSAPVVRGQVADRGAVLSGEPDDIAIDAVRVRPEALARLIGLVDAERSTRTAPKPCWARVCDGRTARRHRQSQRIGADFR